jgi:hypothetical protein
MRLCNSTITLTKLIPESIIHNGSKLPIVHLCPLGIKHGISIKHRLHEFISIVKPETLLAWNRKMKKEKWTYNNTPKGPGRPKKGKETEEIIIKMATDV